MILALCIGLVILILGVIGIGNDDNGDSGHRWKMLNETDRECTHCGRIKREHCRDHRRACPVSWEILNEGSGAVCSGDE